jgi:hypothetical protein
MDEEHQISGACLGVATILVAYAIIAIVGIVLVVLPKL